MRVALLVTFALSYVGITARRRIGVPVTLEGTAVALALLMVR